MGLSIIIVCGNDERNIKNAVKSALFADQTIVVFANSTDSSRSIAKNQNPKLVSLDINDEYGKNFAKWRNSGKDISNQDWIFYLDSDEVITPKLESELVSITKSKMTSSYYAVPRQNFFLGKKVTHGGTYPDYQKRFFKKSDLISWEGKLHEYPKVTGKLDYLSNPILHNTHTDLVSMTNKTDIWSGTLAENLYHHHHPPVFWWRVLRMFVTKLSERLLFQKMFLDGTVGWISAIFESFDTALIYLKLWELQTHENRNL